MQKNINAKYAGNIYFCVIQCRNKGDKPCKISMQRSHLPFSVNKREGRFRKEYKNMDDLNIKVNNDISEEIF